MNGGSTAGPSVKTILLTISPTKTSNYTVDWSGEFITNGANCVFGRTIAGVDTILVTSITNLQVCFYTEIVAFSLGTSVNYYIENFGTPTATWNSRLSVFG